jgi:ABC-type transport system substrate-binding protein
MRARLWISVVMLVAGTGLLAAAGFAAPAAKKGGTLRLVLPGDVDSIDPAIASTSGSWMLEFAWPAARPGPTST